MVHVAVNKYDFEKINILEYAFGEGGGGHQKAYAVYAFINVDNCERPLTITYIHAWGNNIFLSSCYSTVCCCCSLKCIHVIDFITSTVAEWRRMKANLMV